MALVTRQITNVGQPLYSPAGELLAGKTITFTLVTAFGAPASAFDGTTGERVVGVVSVVTDASGEFTVDLWPNDRGDHVTQYVCVVKNSSAQAFTASVPSGATALTWLAFKLSGATLTALEITAIDLHIADLTAHDAASVAPARLYGRNPATTTLLTWGYYGGTLNILGTLTAIANGTVALTASQTNYVEVNPATGAVSKNTIGFTTGSIPLYAVVCSSSASTGYTDYRAFILAAQRGKAYGVASLAADGFVPLEELPASVTAAETNAKAYADGLVIGLVDDRGSYDASGNIYPSTGGSGTAGAIRKGDLWYISVGGMLGGVAVTLGDAVRALTDTPGQTATNWAVMEMNLGYTPENVANKSIDGTMAANSTTLYPSQSAAKTYADAAAAASIVTVKRLFNRIYLGVF